MGCPCWGVGITVVNMLAGNPVNPIDCGAVAMLGGFPVVVIASLVSPRLDKEHVNAIFRCYGKAS